MNVRTCLENGFEIIENVDIEQRYRFEVNQANAEQIDQETDVLGALTLCEAVELDGYVYDDATTYHMYYKDKQLLCYARHSEITDYIDKLVMKAVFGTIQVNAKQFNQFKAKALKSADDKAI